MPQLIEVPGQGIVEFPDGMSDDDIAKAIQQNSSIQEMNPTESLQTPMVGMGGTGGVQGLMNPAQLSGALPMAGTVPPLPQPSGSLQQYIGLNQQRQQIEAAALDERSKVHSYPFVDMLQRNVGYNPTAFTGQVDPAKFQPLFPQDPVQKEILAEIEQKRVQDLAKLAMLSQQQGFEKMPGTELPDITKPMMSFGIRPNTVQAALGTGPTTSKVISGLQQAAAGVPETFSSPLGMAAIPGTIPKLVGQTVPKLVTGGFVADMTAHLPEQVRMAKEAIDAGDTEGAARALGSIALTGIMLGKEAATYGPKVGKAFRENTPITPEVLPKQDRPVEPARQLGEQAPIDVETTGPAQITQARRFYQSESKNPPVDASQLTQVELAARLEANKPLEQLLAKKTYEGGPIVIGENQPQNIAKSLGIRYDGVQDYGGFAPKKEAYTSLDPKNPFTIYVDVGTPKAEVQARLKEKQQQDVVQTEAPKIYTPELATKPVVNPEGGKISFATPAESGAIPSARQSALPIGGEKAIPPQAPQIGQGAKMIGEGIKDSPEKSKAPINESELSDSKNESNEGIEYRNTGGLTKKQQDWITSSARKLLSSPKDLRYSPDRKGKYDGGQLVARLLNNVPPGEREVLEQAGIREKFKAGQKVSSEEVDKWIGENEPKVEVRKFGGKNTNLNERRAREIQHELDTLIGSERSQHLLNYGDLNEVLTGEEQPQVDNKVRELFAEYDSIKPQFSDSPSANWQSVAPKPESEMKDYVEIAVVKPMKGSQERSEKLGYGKYKENESVQFPSSHSFPPNTLGFVRGYMEGDTFHVIEVQSDWAQKARDMKQRAGEEGVAPGLRPTLEKDAAKFSDPLLAHYERLALKSAIEHARTSGAKRIAIQDAESAMLMEGHDRQFEGPFKSQKEAETAKNIASMDMENIGAGVDEMTITQIGGEWYLAPRIGGMRLHYDQILPKMLRELTGEQGEKVTFGEHKMARAGEPSTWTQIGADHGGEFRKDLIFKNADGTPKTDITALSFPLDKVSEAQSKAPFTTMGSDKVKETKTPEGRIEYYHSGIPINPQTLKDIAALAKLGFKAGSKIVRLYAEPMTQALDKTGKPVSKQFAKEARDIISYQKGFFGDLAETLDPAKKAVGGHESKAFSPGEYSRMAGLDSNKSSPEVWLRELNETSPGYAYNNLFGVNEGVVRAPDNVLPILGKFNSANMEIGYLTKEANPDVVPTGKLQRIPTSMKYDLVKRGIDNPVLKGWAEETAKLNGKPVEGVKTYLKKLKTLLDNPESDLAQMDSISQDFQRKYPRTITHVKINGQWQELVTSDPFNYLESAAQKASHAAAFRKVFPLIRDEATGELHRSGLLPATRKAIMAELDTSGIDGAAFDNLVRVLQGHPLDQYTKGWNAPDQLPGMAARAVDDFVLSPLRTMMLSGNFITNLPETAAGAQYAMFGVKNVLQGMVDHVKRGREAYTELELIGAVDKVIKNYVPDPSSPARSASRIARNIASTGFAEQLLNEVQETTAASGARVVAKKIQAGELDRSQIEDMRSAARLMRFSDREIKKMVNGDEAELLKFVRAAAASSTAGHQHMAEKSRAGASRLFNKILPFHSYMMTVYNQFHSSLRNIAQDLKQGSEGAAKFGQTGSSAQFKVNMNKLQYDSKLLAKLVAARGVQGMLATGILALVTGAITGLKQRKEEAQEDMVGFVKDSLKQAAGGPLVTLRDVAVKSGESKDALTGLLSLSATLTTSMDAFDALRGTGKYEGWKPEERLGKFFESRMPAWRLIKTGMAMSGLSKGEDNELRVAKQAFYRWARKQDGYNPPSGGGGRTEQELAMSKQVKRALIAMDKGEDWRSELIKVEDLESAARSLRQNTMLEFNGKQLTDEQKEDLKKRLGEKLYGRLETRDAMIRQVARELTEVRKETKTLKEVEPTGDKYVDQTTGTQRSDRVAKMLKPETLQFLELNKKKVPSFEPEFGLVNKKLMTKEQGERFEKLYAEELDKRLASVITNQVLMSKPLVKRQERIQERIELAKEMAQVRFRAQERAGTSR